MEERRKAPQANMPPPVCEDGCKRFYVGHGGGSFCTFCGCEDRRGGYSDFHASDFVGAR